MLLSQDQAEALARRVLGLSRADGCIVALRGSARRTLRFASRGGATNSATSDVWLTVTATFGRRQGRASTGAVDEAALADVVARAEAAARLAPENPETMPVLGPQSYPASAAYVAATAGLTAADLADLATPCVRRAQAAALDLATFVAHATSWRAVATSGGAVGFDRATRLGLTMSLRNRRGTWSGWAGTDENDAGRVDGDDLARRAVDKAQAQPDPIALDPGKYVVLLEPTVVGEMLVNLTRHLDARATDEGRSFLSHREGATSGARLLDPRVTIASDPADPTAPGWCFDGEGVPNKPVAWIEGGVAKTLVRSRYWAQKTGTEPVPRSGFYRMTGGGDGVAEMIREVKRGILLTRLWYVRMVDPNTLVVTGLSRDGTFLIEDGAVTRPIDNFRFNESPVAVFGNIIAMGPSQRVHLSESRVVVSAPPLLVKDFTFTSLSPAV